jgi:hypothetical protein
VRENPGLDGHDVEYSRGKLSEERYASLSQGDVRKSKLGRILHLSSEIRSHTWTARVAGHQQSDPISRFSDLRCRILRFPISYQRMLQVLGPFPPNALPLQPHARGGACEDSSLDIQDLAAAGDISIRLP